MQILLALLLGTLVAVSFAAGSAEERSLTAVLTLVQLVMSVVTPAIGVDLVHDLRRTRRRAPVLPVLVAGLVVATGIALFGVAAAVAATGAGAGATSGLGWLVLGSVLVQGVALLIGTGLGLLIPSRVLAFMATIVIPLGLWRLFGTSAALEPARGWLTPYESARRLLAGGMTPYFWLQFAVMVLFWGPVLHAVGIRLLRGRSGPSAARSRRVGS